MERDATKTAAITELAARLGSAGDSAQLHRSVTSSAAMILEAEHAVLRLQDPGTGRYQIRSYFGSAETDAQAQAARAREGDLDPGALAAPGRCACSTSRATTSCAASTPT